MMATVSFVTSSSGNTKCQADGFLFDRVYSFVYSIRRRYFTNALYC